MNSQFPSLWTEVERSADHLVRLITSSRAKISIVESEMIDHLASVSQDCQKSLTTARRLLAAMENRLNTINSFLQHATEDDLRAAIRTARSPLVLPNDSINKLISEADIAPIEPANLKPIMDSLLARIVIKKQRASY